jgi:hypothetical protein
VGIETGYRVERRGDIWCVIRASDGQEVADYQEAERAANILNKAMEQLRQEHGETDDNERK